MLGRKTVEWRRTLDEKWDSLRFGAIRLKSQPDGQEIEVDLFLNGIDPNSVRVQLYADAVNEDESVKEMTRVRTAPNPATPDVYRVTASSVRPIGDYTARVIPTYAGVAVPLECTRIAWQR